MLNKKELRSIPVLPVPEAAHNPDAYLTAADLVELPRSGLVLVVDVFYGHNRALVCRFFSDGKTYYSCWKWPDGDWSKSNPAAASWYPVRSISCKDDTELAEQFLGKKEKDSWRTQGVLAVVDAFVSEITQDRRDRAEDRKEELRRKHFAMFPPLPSDLEEYCEASVFDHSYIFFDKLTKSGRRYARCGNCGKKYRIARDVKQNQATVCPHCGTKALYKASWRAQGITDKTRLCVTAKVDNQLLIRWMDVTRRLSSEHRRSYDFQDYAYNLYLQTPKKLVLYAYENKTIPYYGLKAWRRWPNGTQCFSETYVYTNNLDEVFGSDYYNVDLRAGLEGKKQTICFTQLLNNLKRIPAAEYLFKLNLPQLAAVANYLNTQGRSKPGFSEVLGVSKQLLPMYRDYSVTADEHYIIKAYGGWVSPEDLLAYRDLHCTTWNDRNKAEMLLKTMTFKKFVHYFAKQKLVCQRKIGYLMTKYQDYIGMCEEQKIDLSHKSVRFPKDIVEAHDELLKRITAEKNAEIDAAFAAAVAPIYEKMPVASYENKEYCIVFPQLRSDLIVEGQSLNHCVGKHEHYYKNHMAGTQMIFFVRRVENRNKPYFTMELDMKSLRIMQLYGFGDSQASKYVRAFAEGFANALKKGKKKEMKTA